MTEKILQSLEGVSKTLLMTLYVRARESQLANCMMKDDNAVMMVNRLDCDFSRLRMHRHDEIAVIIRMKKFDNHVCDFLKRNPDGVVIHIGCGLDIRFDRVDNSCAESFDLDIPEVMELRWKLISNESSRYHTLAASVFDEEVFYCGVSLDSMERLGVWSEERTISVANPFGVAHPEKNRRRFFREWYLTTFPCDMPEGG